ncbi:MAG: hypothetical protein JF887_13420 [Candidatus Dormibacteraeota bacterium]|uniref:Uncharacterized protein n=1 Tax=Candidatus Amunia macphersoniae TaxID=3127014 RepID=A0A934KSN3_9BACT|nr:hypothetical protein [Candidatus Dormibacteraeota bacterium]
MSRSGRSEDGDSQLAAPTEPTGPESDSSDGIDAGSPADSATAADEDDDVVGAARTRRARPSPVLLLLAAVLVVLAAQLAITFLALGVGRQARDQQTLANGLQRCLLQANLNQNNSTDPTGAIYKAAVQSCLNR